jgi:hypothetical protein
MQQSSPLPERSCVATPTPVTQLHASDTHHPLRCKLHCVTTRTPASLPYRSPAVLGNRSSTLTSLILVRTAHVALC